MESSKLLNLLKNSANAEELKGFWTDLGNNLLGMVVDTANNILPQIALAGAISLAGVASGNGIPPIGKRDFWTELGDSLLSQVTTAVNPLLSSLSLTAAQLLAQFVSVGGLLGKRNAEELKGFFDALTDALFGVFNQVLLPAVNNQLTNVSLLGAHVLGGLSQESDIIGTLTNLLGKRSAEELRGFWDSLLGGLTGVVNQVLLPAVNNQLTNVALLGAHVLGGLSQENDIIGTIATLTGKRDINRDFWTELGDSLLSQVTTAVNPLLSSLSLTAAQLLAQFVSVGGLLGKRDAEELKGFLDSLTDALFGVFNQVLLPAVNNQLTNVSLLGAHVLGGLSQESDIIGTLTNLLGKRQVAVNWGEHFSNLQQSLVSSLSPMIQDALAALSLNSAVWLANFSQNGGLLG